ncbi:coiled-coil domain-containing protein 191 [Antennarius striatus]|uniref:coiled-coil domain-containing protein 191 n=1 Tax=Antennarius striatus TaxID=241820 RepID=UPI0035B1B852
MKVSKVNSIAKQVMTYSSQKPHLHKWRMPGTGKTYGDNVHVKKDAIDHWRKHVEMASELAVSNIFPHNQKRHVGIHSVPVPLQTSDQLRDHDEAYSEAQALLSDWFSSKLRVEMEMEKEDDLMCSAERRTPAMLTTVQPDWLDYSNFHDLYHHLAEEEEGSTVNSVLQDLMEKEVLDCGMMEELVLDVGQTKKTFRDPIITMEARHLQVQENRARREAERQRQQRERDVLRDARLEVKKREQREEMRRKQEAQREEEMVRQEMVRLRRHMEERRCNEQLHRPRQKERIEGQRVARSLHSTPPLPTNPQRQDLQRLYIERKIQSKLLMHNLKCLQRHFSGWYSVVLDQRLRMGKARALYDWKRQLSAWRVWRAAVWAGRNQRELAKTEQELRTENRQDQLAVENDRHRLLRRCVNEWQLWCRMEKEQRQLLAQQQETRRKMAALIKAASAGIFIETETPTHQPVMAQPVESNQLDAMEKRDHCGSGPLAPNSSALHQNQTPVGAVAPPTQPWQVTRRHTAPTPAELHEVRQRREGGISTPPRGASSQGGRWENRHVVQQQIIAQQRKLLKEQQEQIAQLRQQQSVICLEPELKKSTPLTQLSAPRGSRPEGRSFGPTEQRAPRVNAKPQRKAFTQQPGPHPIVTAMEVRAQQRAERRKEIEELKKKKEEEKLAELKAAEEQRQKEMEEEKSKAAEKKKEEKRQEREREKEKQRQLKRQQELLKLARYHYHRNLLLLRGLVPWKRLVQLRQANVQLAESHHNLSLLRRCTLGWQQSARESLSEKKAYADQLYQHFLLQRSLSCWKRLKDWRMVQAERAERFYRVRTQKRFLSALVDHVTEERLVDWDRQEKAEEHNNRRMLWRCFLAWRQIPSLLRIERMKETRREMLGRKVAEVLPDFFGYKVKPIADSVPEGD